MIKTNLELVSALKNIVANYKTLYIMGCFGAPMTISNKKRYTTNNSYNMNTTRTAMINAASADTFGFDCVCLIKGLLWGWTGDKTKTYGGAVYASNGVPDISEGTMITNCTNVSTTGWNDMIPGEVVWKQGHIGVYVGDGKVIECSPSYKNSVQETACLNIKAIAGMNGRKWTKHGKLPYITYTTSEQTPNTPQASTTTGSTTNSALAVGTIVNFTGNKHYTSANATSGTACKPGSAKITAMSKGAKHPYHLVHTDKTSNVYGWVDATDINTATNTITNGNASTVKTHKVVSGDTLSKIAQKYGTTVAKVLEANKSKYPKITANYIVVGWTLTIPQ